MVQLFYGIMFAASLICAAIYVFMWHKHFDVNFTLVFTIVPVACLGYVMFGSADSLQGAIRAMQVIYIGGCFLQLFVLLSILSLCNIKTPKWVLTVLFIICSGMYLLVLSIGHLDLFYKNVSFDVRGGTPVFYREYGVTHSAFYVMVCLFFVSGIIAIVYSIAEKKQVPRAVVYLLLSLDVVCTFSYFLGKIVVKDMEIVPFGYVLALIVYLLIAYRVNLYDVSETVIDSVVHEWDIGYVSCDFKRRYLGSNETAKILCPELRDKAVDESLGYKPSERKIRHYLDSFARDEKDNSFVFVYHPEDGSEDDEKYYNVNVGYLYDGNRKKGYLMTFTDDTANRKYMQLIDDYNESLKTEVDEKTRHIVEMHDNLIMSLAIMVESRDNSTGGHIRRTSECVKILIDEIKKEGSLDLSDEFCNDMIKAAPMHDLGKIAVDDAILRKPGRFTPEEYDKMKKHAAEGARVIHEILLNTDDGSFKALAENVAHFHHERWDGSGYPEKLSGEDIPIEARIMAIADVYDALVSKRVYKEAFDFEKADNIIMDGMGSQFDPGLRTIYENARPRLEEYYKNEAG